MNIQVGPNVDNLTVGMLPPGTIFMVEDVRYKVLRSSEHSTFVRVMSAKPKKVTFANGRGFETQTIKDIAISRGAIPTMIVEVGDGEELKIESDIEAKGVDEGE